MSEQITITMSRAAAAAFIEHLAGPLGSMVGARGCNDLDLKDTKENRELYDILEAENVRLTVEQWRASADYEKPRGHKGQLYFQDYAVFGHIVRKIKEALK
jgi:hypothetical protein